MAVDSNLVKKHQKILGADGTHIGTVDHVDGDRIKLTKADSTDGKHHYLSLGLVASVDEEAVHLSANGAEAHDIFEEDE